MDKILKGAEPAKLPIEQPTKFELVINLKATKQIRSDGPAVSAVSGGQGDSIGVRRTMNNKLFAVALCVLLFALSFCFPAQAQQPKKVPRIGYLSSSDPITESTRSEGIRQALHVINLKTAKQIGLTIPPNVLARADRVIR